MAVVPVHQVGHVGCGDVPAEQAVVLLITRVTGETNTCRVILFIYFGQKDGRMGQWTGGGPVSEQQSSQDVGSVFCSDLIRDHHLLHHLLGDARQSLLLQVEQHRSYQHKAQKKEM